MAAIPCGIESWRKPVVFEKTRTANLGCVSSASATRLKGARRTLKTISSDETLAFTEPVGREGVRCPGEYELDNFMIIIITRAGWVSGGIPVDRVLPCQLRVPAQKTRAKEIAMKWKTPVIIEIAVGLEINAYVCAEVE
jgi:coenzyme PQQ precursor peptide PqqA